MAYSPNAQRRYNATKTRITLNLIPNTDADIIAFLQGVKSKQGAVKEAVRYWMKQHPDAPKTEQEGQDSGIDTVQDE